MGKLLDILPGCGSQAFGVFCEILSSINPSMAKVLRNSQSTTIPVTPAISMLTWLANAGKNFCSIL